VTDWKLETGNSYVSLFVVPEPVLDEEFDVSDFVVDSLLLSGFFSPDSLLDSDFLSPGPFDPADPPSLEDFFA